jgi:hypothetical protein
VEKIGSHDDHPPFLVAVVAAPIMIDSILRKDRFPAVLDRSLEQIAVPGKPGRSVLRGDYSVLSAGSDPGGWLRCPP